MTLQNNIVRRLHELRNNVPMRRQFNKESSRRIEFNKPGPKIFIKHNIDAQKLESADPFLKTFVRREYCVRNCLLPFKPHSIDLILREADVSFKHLIVLKRRPHQVFCLVLVHRVLLLVQSVRQVLERLVVRKLFEVKVVLLDAQAHETGLVHNHERLHTRHENVRAHVVLLAVD